LHKEKEDTSTGNELKLSHNNPDTGADNQAVELSEVNKDSKSCWHTYQLMDTLSDYMFFK